MHAVIAKTRGYKMQDDSNCLWLNSDTGKTIC